jgi:Protein of unknown function (DUF2752)
MMSLVARPAFPAFAIACVTMADLAAGRLLLRADATRVYFAGRAIGLECAFRAATGLPCPTCGVSRAIVLSLHGEWARAWQMAPVGPVAVAGLTAFALAMFVLAVLQSRRADGAIAAARAWIRRGALVYAAAAAAIWLGGWIISFESAWVRR